MGAYAMVAPEFSLMQGMTEQQRMMFMGQYNAVRKDGTVGVLLALFLGGFGAHRFYMGEMGLGILYFVFVWTGIPSIVALIECFLMPGRVRAYNWNQANFIAAQVRAGLPA
jgi:TM2 domain-containing membrane protein YozV